jgi:hypothetical protein
MPRFLYLREIATLSMVPCQPSPVSSLTHQPVQSIDGIHTTDR